MAEMTKPPQIAPGAPRPVAVARRRVGQRGQQPSFAGRMADPQMSVAEVELVKFEVHQPRLVRKADCVTAPIGSCAAYRGSRPVSPLKSTS